MEEVVAGGNDLEVVLHLVIDRSEKLAGRLVRGREGAGRCRNFGASRVNYQQARYCLELRQHTCGQPGHQLRVGAGCQILRALHVPSVSFATSATTCPSEMSNAL